MLNAVQQQTDAVGRDILPFREDTGELWQIRDISTEMVKADNGNVPGDLQAHISQLKHDEIIDAVDIPQLESFDAATLFARAEGIIPAPESSHAIAATIREAIKAREEGKKKVILFNLSGHGLIDMTAYDRFFANDLTNYEIPDSIIAQNTAGLDPVKNE